MYFSIPEYVVFQALGQFVCDKNYHSDENQSLLIE